VRCANTSKGCWTGRPFRASLLLLIRTGISSGGGLGHCKQWEETFLRPERGDYSEEGGTVGLYRYLAK